MYSLTQLKNRVTAWNQQTHHFDFEVRQPNSFSIAIEMRYTEPWMGDIQPDVNSVKSLYTIHYSLAHDEFVLDFPTQTCPNQQVPDPDWYEIDRDEAVVHSRLETVEDELFNGVAYDAAVLNWLPDYIERWRFQRYSDVLPGVGPATSQDLYDEYHSLRALHAMSFTELDEILRTSAAKQLPPLNRSYNETRYDTP